jgi:hypothetical protein
VFISLRAQKPTPLRVDICFWAIDESSVIFTVRGDLLFFCCRHEFGGWDRARRCVRLVYVGLLYSRGGGCMRGHSQAWRGRETGDMEGEDGAPAEVRKWNGVEAAPAVQA